VALRAAGACILASFLLLAGCDAFFGVNILKGLDKVPAPDPGQYDYATAGDAGLKKLASDLGSKAIVSALIADPTTTATIETNLQTTYNDPTVPVADRQLAAALYCDVNLKTTSGQTFVNNVVDVVLSGTGSGQTIQQILQGIVPADVASDPVAFSAMVGGLVNAAAAYQLLGASLAAPAAAPPGVNMGDVAQKAAVAYMMQSMIYEIGGGTANATQQMYNLINNQANTVPSSPIDPFSTPIAPYDSTSLQNIRNIFTVAGATMPS
jgi:hypothetical protein